MAGADVSSAELRVVAAGWSVERVEAAAAVASEDGVIRRVYRSASVAAVLRGLYRAVDEVRLIGSWDGNPAGLAALVTTGTRRPNTRALARLLAQPVRVCERVPERYVYHLVLRTAAEDRPLSDEEWGEVAAAMMAETGIAPASNGAGCRWVALRVADAAVHVVATLAGTDGRDVRVEGDVAAAARVAHRYEQRYGLASSAPGRAR